MPVSNRDKECPASGPPDVLRFQNCEQRALSALLAGYGLTIEQLERSATVPGSYWGDSEAGLIGQRLLARADTPVHSILHEACHYICMDQARRRSLDTNAGGDYDEENAVCYLQILMSDLLPDMGRDRMFTDMDAWGYSFRLGSARAWFEKDAEDARAWLLHEQLITPLEQPSGQLRQ